MASTQDSASLVTSNAASEKSVGTSTRRITVPFNNIAAHDLVTSAVSRVQCMWWSMLGHDVTRLNPTAAAYRR